jgi:hypothetical protein
MISNRELRSLGLLPAGKTGYKRKQVPSPWSESKRVHMDRPSIFDEFSLKVNDVLQCPDHKVILNALRDLAEGKRATLLGGTVVQPLSGIGQQARGNESEGNYRETMSALLSWGIRSFPVQPSLSSNHLWTSMAILDGPKGYNQLLVRSTSRPRTSTDCCY